MKLNDILTEAVGGASALAALRAGVHEYIRTLHDIKQVTQDKFTEGDPQTARRLGGLKKAQWVGSHYYTSKKHGDVGIQPAARELAKRAKDPRTGAMFKQLSDISLSAKRGSGRAGSFDEIGDLLTQIGARSRDESFASSTKQISKLRNEIAAIRGPEDSSPDTPRAPKAPRDDLTGQQNAQAEETFNQIVGSLPNDVQKRVRQNTQRMSPTNKLAYLRNMM